MTPKHHSVLIYIDIEELEIISVITPSIHNRVCLKPISVLRNLFEKFLRDGILLEVSSGIPPGVTTIIASRAPEVSSGYFLEDFQTISSATRIFVSGILLIHTSLTIKVDVLVRFFLEYPR